MLYALLSIVVGLFVNLNLISLFTYKTLMMIGGFVIARVYWNLSDNGWFSAPLFFLQIGLIWALFYFITVAPEYTTFAAIYNRFADIVFYFIIGCSIYRIRKLKKLMNKESLHYLSPDALQPIHEELDPKKFPFHTMPDYIKE